MDVIPIVSQIKSLVQLIGGDSQGAKQTQQNFSKRCPLVSQARSLVHWVRNENQQAREVQQQFLDTLQGFVDGVPVVGHIKGGVHYATGNRQKGDNAMKAASRTAGVLAGGVIGGILGGPPGAIAGGILGGGSTDGITTAIDSAVHHEFRPAGYIGKIDQIASKVKQDQNVAGAIFDMAMMPVVDAFVTGNYKTQQFQSKHQYKDEYASITEERPESQCQEIEEIPLQQTCHSEQVYLKRKSSSQKEESENRRSKGRAQSLDHHNRMKKDDLAARNPYA